MKQDACLIIFSMDITLKVVSEYYSVLVLLFVEGRAQQENDDIGDGCEEKP